MLVEIKKIDAAVVDRLFAVYAESMEDLAADFGSAADMRADYEGFLREFIRKPGQLMLVEADGDQWVSALRAVEYRPGVWFMEAVETAPDRRGQGFGKRLLTHTVERLSRLGAKQIECIIHSDNTASKRLHTACGFAPTDDAPVNCWGETETGCVLWRYSHGGTGKEQKKESNWRFVEVLLAARKPSPRGSAAAHSRPAAGGSWQKQLFITIGILQSTFKKIGIALRAAVGSRATIIRLRRAA